MFVQKICTYSVDEIDTWQLIFKVIWERRWGKMASVKDRLRDPRAGLG